MLTRIDPDAPKPTGTDKADSLREEGWFFNAVPSILIGLDSQGHIKCWNDAAVRTFGLEKKDVLGKTLSTCGIDWLTEDIDSTIIAEGRPELRRALDNIRFQKQGSSRTLGLNINWIKLPDSQRSELLIIGSDITERKRAEDEPRAKTAFLEAQIQATIDAILIVDEQASVIWKNQRFIQLFDVPQSLWNSRSDELLLSHVLEKIADPKTFLEKVNYLYRHRAAHPSVAYDLLSRIPRLEPIAWMIEHQNRPIPPDGGPEQADIRKGAELLRLVLAYEDAIHRGSARNEAAHLLARLNPKFSSEFFSALVSLDPSAEEDEVKSCRIEDLAPGMIVQQKVRAHDGTLVLSNGQEITATVIFRLTNLQSRRSIPAKDNVSISGKSDAFSKVAGRR